ncbi:MAG: NAD(P)H-dependent flavin oxidoreductase [Alphaproteobacteria bacterium]
MAQSVLLQRLGLEHPIIQAPMSGVSTPKLAAAVSNAGGIGALGLANLSLDGIRDQIRATRAQTNKAFVANLFCYERPAPDAARAASLQARVETYLRELPPAPGSPPPLPPDYRDQLAVLIDERVPVFSCTFGAPPREIVARLKAHGSFTIGTATTVAEAAYLESIGMDAVVAQGAEAGGHRGTFMGAMDDALIGTMALVPMIVDAVRIPVIAAGGIMDGRGVAAALLLGAEAVQMGTAFLTCPEVELAPAYLDTLLNRHTMGTTISRAYTGREARFVKNSYVREMQTRLDEVPPYPYAIPITGPLRFRAKDRPELFPMLAGQGYPMVKARLAAELVREFASEAAALLARGR